MAQRGTRPAASGISSKENPLGLPGGKENARPFEKGTGIRRKLSFTGCEGSRAKPIAQGTGERARSAIARTLTVKKTPFHVHCDERNAAPGPSETAGKPRGTKDDRKRAAASVAPAPAPAPRPPASPSRANGRGGAEAGENRGARGPGDDPPSEPLRRSKIPRRSRSTSGRSSVERHGVEAGRRRVASTGSAGEPGASSRAPPTRISSSATAATAATRERTREEAGRRCFPADSSRLAARPGAAFAARGGLGLAGPRAAVLGSRNAATPVDGAPPPPVPAIPPKLGGRREAERAGAPGERARTEPFPGDLMYHAEYSDDLPGVEREREERSPRLSAGFLAETSINAEQRRLVVGFLIRLGTHCRYPSFIVYRTVKLFDAAMDRIRTETAFIQLTALASLWIALKQQENFHRIPTAPTILALAEDLYLGREDLLLAYERKILRALDFNVTFADAFTLYAHHLINCRRHIDATEETTAFLYNCGGYLIDLTLLDEQFCRSSVALVAASAIELALGLVLDAVADGTVTPRWLFWRGLLFAAVPQLAGRFRDRDIDRTRVAMLRRLLGSARKRSGFDAVHKKYSRGRYGRISERLVERATRVSATETLYDA